MGLGDNKQHMLQELMKKYNCKTLEQLIEILYVYLVLMEDN